jgi:acyl dehydratase
MSALVLENPRELAKFVGREIGVSHWLRITLERVQQFADATEDRQWIHVDAKRAAAESPFGAPIAHGFLTLSLASYFLGQVLQFRSSAGMAVNYGLNRLRFTAPVRVGSHVRGRFAVQSATDSHGYLECLLAVSIEVQGEEKPCCVLEWVVRFYD